MSEETRFAFVLVALAACIGGGVSLLVGDTPRAVTVFLVVLAWVLLLASAYDPKKDRPDA